MIIFMRKKDWITIVKCEILTHIHIKLCKILNLERILYIYVYSKWRLVRPMKHFVLENINLKIYNVHLNWKSWKYYIYITNIYFACLFVCMFITYKGHNGLTIVPYLREHVPREGLAWNWIYCLKNFDISKSTCKNWQKSNCFPGSLVLYTGLPTNDETVKTTWNS